MKLVAPIYKQPLYSTTMNNIVNFISLLGINNNREWFNENKDLYQAAKDQFDDIFQQLIFEIGKFDSRILNATPKECVFRIYRDVRFSHDKRPYKQQFSGFISYPLGWKSKYAGYYIHVDAEGAYFSAGIWRPEPDMLKALRNSVVDNYDELKEIRSGKEFNKTFGDNFYDEDKLKRMPVGFPKDFAEPELLKLKHYMVNHELGDVMDMSQENFIKEMANLAKTAYPFIRFLNDTVDETI